MPLILLGGVVLLYFVWPAFGGFVNDAYAVLTSGDRPRIEQWVRGFGLWGPVAVVLLMLVQTIVPVIPSYLLMIVTVLAYGAVWGAALAYGSLLLAAAVAYLIGHGLGRVAVDKLIGHAAEAKLCKFVDRYGTGAVIIARISPVISTDAVSIVAGLARMPFGRFMLATAIGTVPLTLLIAYLGEDIDRLQSGLLWISVATVVGFVAYVAYDRYQKR